MGIYGALSTAVSGLKAQSFALENISGNIANSQTTGFKRIETNFIDLIPDAPLKRQMPGSVIGVSQSTNDIAGDIRTVSTETYIALNGSGFFVVEPRIGQADNQAIFGGNDYYTRRGDFEIDKSGFLVNGAGNYLKGLPIDRTSGNVSGSVPEVIQITNALLPAAPTTRIDYQLNLPQVPKNAAYNAASGVAGSELLVLGDYAADPTTGGTALGVQANDTATFMAQSSSGGAITVYTENGAPANVQLRWAKVQSAQGGGTDTWNLFYLSNSTATGTATQWTNTGTAYSFGPDGALDPAMTSTTLNGLSVDGVPIGNVTLNHGVGGVTQFADANGTVQARLGQNGFAAGDFLSVAINDNGRIVASYSNGRQVDIAQVVVANFNGANQLKRLDGSTFAATSESGDPIYTTGGGIIGSALESSNTDISEEFTKLIVTQQAYSAGTRIVSTADEMLQEALNMVR